MKISQGYFHNILTLLENIFRVANNLPSRDHKHDHAEDRHVHQHEQAQGNKQPQHVKFDLVQQPKNAMFALRHPMRSHGHDHGNTHGHHDHAHGHAHDDDHHPRDHDHTHAHDHDHHHEWDETLNADGVPVSLARMEGVDFAHLIE